MLIWCLIVIGAQLLIMVLIISNVGKFLLLNIYENHDAFFQDSFQEKKNKKYIINVFTITFDQFNMSLMNKSTVNNQKCFWSNKLTY